MADRLETRGVSLISNWSNLFMRPLESQDDQPFLIKRFRSFKFPNGELREGLLDFFVKVNLTFLKKLTVNNSMKYELLFIYF